LKPWDRWNLPARHEEVTAAVLRAVEDVGDHEDAVNVVLRMRLTHEEALSGLVAALTAARVYHHRAELHGQPDAGKEGK
jgi:hypothetical protein